MRVLTFVVLLVAIVLILIYYRLDNKIEGYTDRYTDTDLNKCAELCKTIAGCYGFGYDKDKQICYPSKDTIDGQPIDDKVLYRTEYSKDNAACNKLEPVIQPTTGAGFEQRRKNSIYVCKEKEGMQPQWYLHSFSRFRNLGEGVSIDQVFDIDKYEVRPYKWPVNKYNTDQLDLLIRDRTNADIDVNTVTILRRMETPDEQIDNKILIPPPPSEEQRPELDFGLEDIRNHIIKTVQNIKKSVTVQNRLNPNIASNLNSNKETFDPEIENQEDNYKISNKMNMGEYMHNYICLKDIPKESCLSYCKKRPDCKGVEWNPELKVMCHSRYDNPDLDPILEVKENKNINICCPKKTIGPYVDRKCPFSNGQFYEKT